MSLTPLTREQSAVISAYTGFMCGHFDDMHHYIEQKMGRPVFTHELPGLFPAIQELAFEDFKSICPKEEAEGKA